MHIAFSGFVFDHGKSGIGTYIKGILAGLSEIDSDNTYDLLFQKGDEKLIPLLGPQFSWKLYPEWLSKPIPNILWHNLCLPWRGRIDAYDVVHIPSFRRVPYFKGKSKLIATVHDMAPLAVEGKYDVFRHFYHKHIQSRMIHRCDRVIAVSASTKNDIIRFTGYPEEKIDVIYSGYNRLLYKPVNGEEENNLKIKFSIEKPFFIYVSRIEHPGKNHIRLIEAFEIFKKNTGLPHQLLLAGADWTGADKVKARAASSSIKEDIRFLGFVADQDLPALYSACEAMVYPSLYEGFGLPIIEAMACGAQVICSNNSSMTEVGGTLSSYFDPKDIEQIAVSLETYAQHSHSQRKERIEYSSQFSWEKAAAQVLETYKK